MKCVTLLACLVLSIAVFYAQAMPPPPQCTPGIIEEIPLRMRKLCTALSTIYELSNAMESYLDDKGVVYQQMMHPENSPLMENGVKRQDVDHVFLRFGRRR
ncbi:myosuppressin [Homalodisca vitripennis]|uniref:myosuppressin n=1 Tax=Homalodisca vitripennis TaxID=197043 RepID=UPI001EEAD325|nr:myosuppressin [Homalodisca vitripennis]